jgi:pimeloyl-ACP methyl ester carboxylesterase
VTTPVVLLASLGRSGSDFDQLVATIESTGRQAVAVNLPGVGLAVDRPAGADLHALAAEVAARIEPLGPRVHLVGHAFGNRVARCLAADHPDRVASLILLGCGGKLPGDPGATDALLRCFTEQPGSAAHTGAVATAFFAPGNPVPPSWSTGWWPEAARRQGEAARATPVDDWWVPPPPIPVLALVGAEDRIAPPDNARHLIDAVGERGRLVVIPGAGHALVPEQPEAVADSVLEFLARIDP